MAESRSATQQLEMLQQQMQQAEAQLAELERSILEVQQAIGTLEAVQEGQTDGPVLLPIGGGVHVRASLDKEAPIVFEIGAETALEGSVQAAIGTLGSRRDKARQAFEQTAGRLQQMAQMAQQLQQGLSPPSE